MLRQGINPDVCLRMGDRSAKYTPPSSVHAADINELLGLGGRSKLQRKQLDFIRSDSQHAGVNLYYSGDRSLFEKRSVAIVGSRSASELGFRRARKLGRELVDAGVVVVSGLAKGIDAAAHNAAIDNGGRTIAVIGTPLEKAYPAENARLQEIIYLKHLLVSPFASGEAVFKSSFPKRNRVMAALTDATVIVEASDTSGTLHQAAECTRFGRWLFIMKSVADDPAVTWQSRFLSNEKVEILESTDQIVKAIGAS
jgi:DNA processing protein